MKKIIALFIIMFVVLNVSVVYATDGGRMTIATDKIVNETKFSGIYKITTVCGKYVDVKDGSQDDGAIVQLWEYADVDSQLFNFELMSDSSYKITPIHSGKPLEVRDSSHEDEASIAQWEYVDGYDCKFWYLRDFGDGWYYIINKNSGKCMDIWYNQTDNGTVIWQYAINGTDAQAFKLVSATIPSTNASQAAAVPLGAYAADKYILESDHIIWDCGTDYLIGNISPENFALYLKRLDMAYEAMADLVRYTPSEGRKIRIIEGETWYGGISLAGDLIGYNCEIIADDMRLFETTGSWSFMMLHEMGHCFTHHTHSERLFNSECTAHIMA